MGHRYDPSRTPFAKIGFGWGTVKSYDGSLWLWIAVLLVIAFWNDVWFSKWRLAVYYGIDSSHVEVDKEPHDCEFLTSPLGEKHCSYHSAVILNAMGPASQGSHRAIYYSGNGGGTWQTWGSPDVQLPDGSRLLDVHLQWVKEPD